MVAMTTREPWECPRCLRVLAPHMDSCDCRTGSAGVAMNMHWAPDAPFPADTFMTTLRGVVIRPARAA